MTPSTIRDFLEKDRKKPAQTRSSHMPIVKRLRVAFYMLATIELVLMSIAWGRLPLR